MGLLGCGGDPSLCGRIGAPPRGLDRIGRRWFPPSRLRHNVATQVREIEADAAAHGLETTPFFTFAVWREVAVFVVAKELEFYVVPYEPEDEWALIGRFEPLGPDGIDELRDILRRDFGKSGPDVHVELALAAAWLAG